MAEQQCACGCGQVITKGLWAPGHDHRAIHSRITRDHGNVANFIEWYDWAYPKLQATKPRKKPGGAQHETVPRRRQRRAQQPKLEPAQEPAAATEDPGASVE